MPGTDYTAAYLTLAGSLGGVTVAGAFAYLTSRRQSAAERGRADRAAVRKALGGTLTAIDQVTAAFRELYLGTRNSDRQKIRSASDQIGASDSAFNTARASLRILLGDEHSVSKQILTMSDLTKEVEDAAVKADASSFQAAMQQRDEALKELVHVAHRELGADVRT